MLTGKAVSRGIAIGPVLRYVPFCPEVKEETIPAQQAAQAVEVYRETRKRACEELDALERRLADRQPEQAKIIAAHREILMDPAMAEEIEELIQEDLLSPDTAVNQVYETYAQALRASPNERMKERAADLLDVKNRVLRCRLGLPEQNLSALPRPVIVVADDLYPSDTAGLDQEKVLGIITQTGGSTSHTAIIARSCQLPAVLGAAGAMELLSDGQRVILDGEEGRIIPSPNEEDLETYRRKGERVSAELQAERVYLDREAVTRDGVRVQVRLNVAAVTDQELSGARHADGCGLFRTEFLYLNGGRCPSEEEQYQAFRRVLEAFEGKPVILRTMDIGGDKQHAGMDLPKEENPFLGVRGLRLSLAREELFRTQLRAGLRASPHGRLKIMFPMVGGLDELRRAMTLVEEEKARLDREGIPWDPDLRFGIMVEVPSAAIIADRVAREVDFISVGTNDLTQYLCAADRMNPAVRSYYQEYHPAVFRLLAYLTETFQAAEKDISVCGELGGDPLALPVLLGLGIRQFSMGGASLAQAKRVICGLSMEEARGLAREVLQMGTQQEIIRRLEEFARERKEEA